LTRAANLREHIDSPAEDDSGEMLTNIRVFESPPRQGYIKNTKLAPKKKKRKADIESKAGKERT